METIACLGRRGFVTTPPPPRKTGMSQRNVTMKTIALILGLTTAAEDAFAQGAPAAGESPR
jgi:hypothetical protein